MKVQHHPFPAHLPILERFHELIPTDGAGFVRVHHDEQLLQLVEMLALNLFLLVHLQFGIVSRRLHRILDDNSSHQVHQDQTTYNDVGVEEGPRPGHKDHDFSYDAGERILTKHLDQREHHSINTSGDLQQIPNPHPVILGLHPVQLHLQLPNDDDEAENGEGVGHEKYDDHYPEQRSAGVAEPLDEKSRIAQSRGSAEDADQASQARRPEDREDPEEFRLGVEAK
eukprot:CAMPEP_0177295502 /NCGR_PEP_ID=MMETSP0368-20130122/1901_1 /TAXON_ID=447022 ORGANISM="Scrippsiella hangoei-like, Strain SHHI-4" /NCGR_SAMPLE_ID=MMETSP0368 /ASSEMBLY_ACC=CAM_ASM_000363 /LENGTH=225 /DNA_ID=CAMNT_0018753521 /DNA_START=325 /DNA_END=1002 /DNA_ORIENTATION=+